MAALVLQDLSECPKDTILHGKEVYAIRNTLPVSAINLSERCVLGCNFCGLDAKPSDKQMSLAMFNGIIYSDHVLFASSERVFLGDGEVIIWQGKFIRFIASFWENFYPG